MNIAVDAMDGDNAPYEIVKGALDASYENKDIQITLIGDKEKILDCVKQINTSLPSNIQIIHTDVFITMEEDPMVILKEKSNSSMGIGLKMLKDDEVDGFISAGSTGALHTGSTLLVRKIKGVRRSAIATVLPFKTPLLLLDSGANPTVAPEILVQWAIVSSVYMKKMFGLENPRVGLLNNGTEECKGTPTVVEAHQMLKNQENINFIGNVEAREIVNSVCDIVVTDGFTGNITLKFAEGMGKFILKKLKTSFTASLRTKLGYLFMKKELKKFKKDFDSSEFGGAPLLGIRKPVIKAHGSSKAKEIRIAIRQTVEYAKSGIIGEVEKELNC